jgi:hypothetical protein
MINLNTGAKKGIRAALGSDLLLAFLGNTLELHSIGIPVKQKLNTFAHRGTAFGIGNF